jgi:filamentous hemagglutinin family protein
MACIALFWPDLSCAQIVTDGSMGAAKTIPGNRHVIGAELGQLKQNNLFHSFSEFSVPKDHIAEFTGPSTVVNVLVRVTGSLPSAIDGTVDIRNSMPSANLFLINPKGVLLGRDAKLNVGGAVHASTADYIRFADNARYWADLTKDSTLSVMEPAAFGFLGRHRHRW